MKRLNWVFAIFGAFTLALISTKPAAACGWGNCYPMSGGNPFVGSSFGGDPYMDGEMVGQWPMQDDFTNWDGGWEDEYSYQRPNYKQMVYFLNNNGSMPMGASTMPPIGASAIYNYQIYKQVRDQMEYQMYSTPGY
ncbi:MAG: hypothetical protein JNL01_12295 [Bdellovibrionales bacterium]|nr:hypothetical protein [Bdellovibrionales bacterium]